jgi:hypothetical protein
MATRSAIWMLLGALLAVSAAEDAVASLHVSFARGRLTGSAQGESLREVLIALARATDAVIVGLDVVDDEPVAFAFDDLPLDEGVHRIVKGRNFTVVLAGAGAEKRLVRLTLTSRAPGGDVVAPIGSLQPEFAYAQGTDERVESIAILARHGDAAAVRADLEHALARDPEPAVRRAALHGLLARGLLDREVVQHGAHHDPDPDIRAEMVRALRLLLRESAT